jgi:hypothetical protein
MDRPEAGSVIFAFAATSFSRAMFHSFAAVWRRRSRAAAKLRRHGGSGAAAECAHVERSELRIAHDHAHGFERDAEFIGNTLRERCADVLPDFNFSGEGGDAAVFADVQPGGDFLGQLVGMTLPRAARSLQG